MESRNAPLPADDGAERAPVRLERRQRSAAAAGAATGAPAAVGAQSMPCTGTSVVCSTDGKLFGECNGASALMRPVSAGTVCKDGALTYA